LVLTLSILNIQEKSFMTLNPKVDLMALRFCTDIKNPDRDPNVRDILNALRLAHDCLEEAIQGTKTKIKTKTHNESLEKRHVY
jgi:hypothetical protein